MSKKAKQFKDMEDLLISIELNGDLEEGFHFCKDGSIVFIDDQGNIEDVTLPPSL